MEEWRQIKKEACSKWKEAKGGHGHWAEKKKMWKKKLEDKV